MHGKTYRDIFGELQKQLNSQLEAREIISFATNTDKSSLLQLGDWAISSEDIEKIHSLVKRRLSGEPLQYIIGQWDFYGLTFKVGTGVLIPRPDTETLVDLALELLQEKVAPEVLDLCSGSGAIAVAIKNNCLRANVTAVELSEDAFFYLSENIKYHGLDIEAVKGDVLEYKHKSKVDLVVSNPPYIKTSQLEGLQKEVKNEPAQALDGGEDGLFFYGEIASLYFDQIKENGYIAFEVGINQQSDVASILLEAGFKDVKYRKDLSGIIRVVYAIR